VPASDQPVAASPNREVLAAVSAILAASKINLANIGVSLKVHEYEELEQRITELERLTEPQTGGDGTGANY
jgi:hypothetical protein